VPSAPGRPARPLLAGLPSARHTFDPAPVSAKWRPRLFFFVVATEYFKSYNPTKERDRLAMTFTAHKDYIAFKARIFPGILASVKR
jgi:hypothetical protein